MRYAMTVFCIAVAACGIKTDFSGERRMQTLEAEKYQREIAAIDQLLFRETPLGDDGVEALQSTIETLAKRVTEADEKSNYLKMEALELRTLADRAGQLPRGSSGAPLQNDWMRIRNNLFDDRAWFVRSAADLEYAAKTVPRSPGTIAGRWQVTSVFANGVLREDRELSGSLWTFKPPTLTIEGSGEAKTYDCEIGTESIHITGNGTDGWIKYQRDPNALHLAFFDGMKEKPVSFNPEYRRDPLFVDVRLAPVR